MTFMDDESTTSLLRPVASMVQSIWQLAARSETDDYPVRRGILAGAQKLHYQLQANYTANLICSTTQLRLLSCTRSSSVAQPAMSWFRMHEPL
jgi:hypothetical protein